MLPSVSCVNYPQQGVPHLPWYGNELLGKITPCLPGNILSDAALCILTELSSTGGATFALV